jgi:hypothetical protein
VEPWIKDHQKDEVYPHAVLLRVKKLDYRTGWPIDPPLQLAQNDQIEGVANVDCLEYGKPGSGWVHRVPIGRDGTLRVLHELSKTLATFFHWQAAQATAFVLTDLTPVIETESVAVHPAPHVTVPYGGPQPLACLVRVTLTIDPIMTPKELARKYASVRNRLLAQKPRALSTKHLALAVFTTKHPALNQESMEQWAREFPQWKYRRISQFGRDARTARSRLLHRSPVDVLGTFSRAKSKPSSD